MSNHVLQPGDIAPDFHLPATTGKVIHFYDVLDRQSAVLFFYVKAFTPVCMAEVCEFRANLDDFRDRNTAVLGIAPDSENLTRRFAEYHNLTFPLLSDESGVVRNLYGVPKLLGLLPGRATFVIGQDRHVKHVTPSNLDGTLHALQSLQSLAAQVGS